METALYFPYIHVPTKPWFTKVLLYWDSAASIVPRRLDNRDAELGSYTSELIRAGLLREVDPYMAQMMNYQAFDETFTLMLDAYEPRKEFGPSRWTRIHQKKRVLNYSMRWQRAVWPTRFLAISNGGEWRKEQQVCTCPTLLAQFVGSRETCFRSAVRAML